MSVHVRCTAVHVKSEMLMEMLMHPDTLQCMLSLTNGDANAFIDGKVGNRSSEGNIINLILLRISLCGTNSTNRTFLEISSNFFIAEDR
jgi:hypothetical protein